jgi:hypothetical protein
MMGAALEGNSLDREECPFREMFTSPLKCNKKTGIVTVTLLLLLKLFTELWGGGF